jgi:hypothetical protein
MPHDDRVNQQAKVENLSRELMEDYQIRFSPSVTPSLLHGGFTPPSTATRHGTPHINAR